MAHSLRNPASAGFLFAENRGAHDAQGQAHPCRMPAPRLPFSQTIADEFCEQIATTRKSMRVICAELGACSVGTILKWLDEVPTFAAQYARAREAQGQMLADEVIELADTTHVEIEVDGETKILPVDPARSRVQVDARKWAASKLAPKVYGDKLAVEHSGSIDLNLKDMSTEELLDQIRQLATLGFIPQSDIEVLDDDDPNADLG